MTLSREQFDKLPIHIHDSGGLTTYFRGAQNPDTGLYEGVEAFFTKPKYYHDTYQDYANGNLGEGEQQALFETHYEPPKFFSVFSHGQPPGSGKELAVQAAIHAAQRFGDLTYSRDLSVGSNSLVKSLGMKGIPEGSENNQEKDGYEDYIDMAGQESANFSKRSIPGNLGLDALPPLARKNLGIPDPPPPNNKKGPEVTQGPLF